MKTTWQRNIRLMYALNFFRDLSFVAAILVPFFTEWGSISLTQVMILQSWFMFCVFALEIPTGTVADRWGRKTSLILSGAIGVVGVFVYTSQPLYYIFFVGEFLWAASAALQSGADDSLVYDSLKESKMEKDSKKIFARVESFRLSGMVAGAIIGSFMAKFIGLRYTMMAMAISFGVSFIIALFLREPKIHEGLEVKKYLTILRDGVKFLAGHRVVKILIFDMVAIASLSYFVIWFYQPVLQRLGVDIKYFGLVHALMVVGQIVIINLYSRFESALGKKRRWLFLSAILTGLAFILMATKFVALVIPAIVLGSAVGLSRRPLFISYINKYLPSATRATVLSGVSMFRQLVLVIVNPLFGWFADYSLGLILVVLGILTIGFALFSRVEEEMLIE